MAQTLLIFVSFFVVFSCTLAFGVTYNAARIALSERGRELATLRVLGFTRAEISYILLGEIGLLTLRRAAARLRCSVTDSRARSWSARSRRSSTACRSCIEPIHLRLGHAGRRSVAGHHVRAARAPALDRLDLIAVLKTRE